MKNISNLNKERINDERIIYKITFIIIMKTKYEAKIKIDEEYLFKKNPYLQIWK